MIDLKNNNIIRIAYNHLDQSKVISFFFKAISFCYRKKILKNATIDYVRLKGVNSVQQVTHPDIIYSSELFDWKYILTVTGYPFGLARLENPFVLVSDDGINFKNVLRRNVPVVSYEGKGRSHYSDSEIVEYNQEIYLFYRMCEMDQAIPEIIISYRKTKDLKNWSEEVEVVRSQGISYVSQSVVVQPDFFEMYYVNQGDEDNYLMRDTSNTINFQNSKTERLQINNIPEGKKIWHVDIIKDEKNMHGLFAFSDGPGGANARVYYASAVDNGSIWNVGKEIILDLDYSNIVKTYRSSMIRTDFGWNIYVPVFTKDECWFLLVAKDQKLEQYR